MQPGEKVAVIVNPRSAHGRTARKWPLIQRAIESTLDNVTFFHTERRYHATKLVQQALWQGFTRIISVGGDGTHFEVTNGFFEGASCINPDAVMAILPYGTGSDLARTLHIPRGLKALPYLASDHTVAADVGRITYTDLNGLEGMSYFLNTCHIGIGGEVVDRVNRNTKAYGGFMSYFWHTIMALISYKDKYMKIRIDDIEIEQTVKELIIAKGQYDGGGMHVAPYARLDNGLFDIYIISPVSLRFALFNLHRLYRGRLNDLPEIVQYFRGKEVFVESPEIVKINTDGEMPGILPSTVQVIPGAIKVVTGWNGLPG
mgnify:FL=1